MERNDVGEREAGKAQMREGRKKKEREGKRKELENVAITNALQLEASRATPAPSLFNYDTMPRLKSLSR